MWAGYLRRYSDWLRTGRFGDRIPVGGGRFSASVQTGPGAHPATYNGYRVFPGGKEQRGRDDPSSPSAVVKKE